MLCVPDVSIRVICQLGLALPTSLQSGPPYLRFTDGETDSGKFNEIGSWAVARPEPTPEARLSASHRPVDGAPWPLGVFRNLKMGMCERKVSGA